MTWAIAAAVAIGAFSATEQKKATKRQSFELERQAEQEELAAQGQEVQRRQRLNKLLSANIVSQSASGISGEGTPESIALAGAKQASLSSGLESLSDKLKQSQLRRQAANIRAAGTTQATSTLLSTGVKAGQLS